MILQLTHLQFQGGNRIRANNRNTIDILVLLETIKKERL